MPALINKKTLGRRGETIAASFLRQKGYRIEAINWRPGRLGEVDLIARGLDDTLVIFVEVKTRRAGQTVEPSCGTPLEAITPSKQAQLMQLAEVFLSKESNPNTVVRFDVIGIYFPGDNRPAEITHIENAF